MTWKLSLGSLCLPQLTLIHLTVHHLQTQLVTDSSSPRVRRQRPPGTKLCLNALKVKNMFVYQTNVQGSHYIVLCNSEKKQVIVLIYNRWLLTEFLKSVKLLKCPISIDIKMSTFTKFKKRNYKTVLLLKFLDFPGGSDGKISACNVGGLE